MSNLIYNNDDSNNTYNIGAIGVSSGGISFANDSVINNIKGYHYYDLIENLTTYDFDSNVWGTKISDEKYGYSPYLLSLGENSPVKKYSLFSGNDDEANFGEELNPYLIKIKEQLNFLSKNVKNGISYENKYLQLNSDIDLNDYNEFEFIGNISNSFMGNFDGNNSSIKNYTFNDATVNNVGLFSNISDGSIKNLTLDGFNITANDYSGILAGNLDNCILENNIIKNSNITGNNYIGAFGNSRESSAIGFSATNLSVENSILSGNNNVGILFGIARDVNLSTSFTNSEITGINNVGGLIGISESGTTIDTCYNNSSVSGQDNVGGLAGYGKANITKSYNMHNISGYNYVGGIIGNGTQSSITISFNRANISGDHDYIGSLAGKAVSTNILNCFSVGNISGDNFVGGLLGEGIDGQFSNCYFAGNVEFGNNGTTIAKHNIILIDCYFNEDLIEEDSITKNGIAKTSLELSNNFVGLNVNFTNENRDLQYGYYPQLVYFHNNELNVSHMGSKCNYFSSGNGNEFPLEITKRSEFINMQRLINTYPDEYGNKNYKLTNDIYLTNEFIPNFFTSQSIFRNVER